jgi:hypothetical protein
MNIFENKQQKFVCYIHVLCLKISQNKNNFYGRAIGWNLFLVCVL